MSRVLLAVAIDDWGLGPLGVKGALAMAWAQRDVALA